MQKPLMHWLALVHAPPLVKSPLQVPVPESQYAPGTQVVSLAHVLAHDALSAHV
jgi:hypothetical protein